MTDNGEAVPGGWLLTRSTSYIPYGEVFEEESSAGWQSPYYFNSKELDEETGLYYYGARYLDPTEARWLSVDPMFEKYVGMSPYNYCAGNPVKYVDLDGKDVFYNAEGDYLGADNNEYKGKILITSKSEYEKNMGFFGRTIPLQDAELSEKAYANIYTDVLIKQGIDKHLLYNESVSVKRNLNNPSNKDFGTLTFNDPNPKVQFLLTDVSSQIKGIKISINQSALNTKELSTVENVYNSIGVHEYKGHGILHFGSKTGDHHKAYLLQIDDISWESTTTNYKKIILNNFNLYTNKEKISNMTKASKSYIKAYNELLKYNNKK